MSCDDIEIKDPQMSTLIGRRSPFFIEVEDPQRDLLDPAVKGTSNVLSSVAKHKQSVRRTIVTSSVAGAPHLLVSSVLSGLVHQSSCNVFCFCCPCSFTHVFAPNKHSVASAAVLGNESAAPPKNGSLYTEDDWNETSSIKNSEAYWLSKVTLQTDCKLKQLHSKMHG